MVAIANSLDTERGTENTCNVTTTSETLIITVCCTGISIIHTAAETVHLESKREYPHSRQRQVHHKAWKSEGSAAKTLSFPIQ